MKYKITVTELSPAPHPGAPQAETPVFSQSTDTLSLEAVVCAVNGIPFNWAAKQQRTDVAVTAELLRRSPDALSDSR